MNVVRYTSICLFVLLYCLGSFAIPDSTKKAKPAVKKASSVKKAEPAAKKTSSVKKVEPAAKKAAPVKKTEPVAKKKTPPAKPQKTGEQKVLGGFISAVDASKKSVIVLLKSKEYPVQVDASTAIVAGNQKITFKNLKKGDRITVKYFKYSDGSRRAVHINNKTYKHPQVKQKPVPKKKPVKAIKKKEKAKPVKKKGNIVKQEKVLPSKPKPDTTRKE